MNNLKKEEQYKKILDSIKSGVYFVDVKRKVNFWNKAAEEITGYTKEEMLGNSCSNNILNHVDEEGNKLCEKGCPLLETIKDGKTREAKVYLKHKDGYRKPVIVHCMPVYEDGKIIGASESFIDLSPSNILKAGTNQLIKDIYYDELTGLPNRKYLKMYFETVFIKYKKLGVKFGVAMFDIDHFKNVNDTYGHDGGDEVLKMLGNLLSSNIRNNDIIVRWGGEEFAGIFECETNNELEEITNRIRMLFENSIVEYNNQIIKSTISIGTTLVKESDDDKLLMLRADELLYKAKETGRNKVVIDN